MEPRTTKRANRTSNKSLCSEQASAVLLPSVAGSTVRDDLPFALEKRRDPYSRFYAALGALREDFHRIGRFDDANAKLDELCKLLVLKVLDARHPIAGHTSRLTSEYLTMVAEQRYGDKRRLALAMHEVYREIADHFPDEMMAFGSRNGLNLSPDDDEFASALLPLFDALPPADIGENRRWSFDGVNEAFGHFIQDSFRNRKEDAQYMTPPEVVSSIVDIAIQDILVDLAGRMPQEPILVADPTCGVGSFLAAMYRHAFHVPLGTRTLADYLHLFGQDKVERMVRLAGVNLRIFAGMEAVIRQGNSILPPTSLADIQGKVDLILTNPPFGATFDSQELLKHSTKEQLPALHALAHRQTLPRTIDSEYILLDRELALLKPGGRLLMVVPDHVVSTGGFSEAFRLTLQQIADLVAVFDLPTETFAQAGTRTKTSVVYLRRKASINRTQPRHVFMATSEDLGFRVVSRAGATVKRIVGPNDMETITETYKTFRQSTPPSMDIVCLSRKPSVAAVATDHLLNNRWTAGFYQTERLQAIKRMEQRCERGFSPRHLVDLVTVDPDAGERVLANDDNRCISVLHVREDGCIDLRAVELYRPTTACTRCKPGDVLLSKINPRIMRICIVPQTPWKLGCSTEFSVLRVKDDRVSPWLLLLLLRSDSIQAQIRTLTSGTSSSHSRIKNRDLATITVPVPNLRTKAMGRLTAVASDLERATQQYYAAIASMNDSFSAVERLLAE